MGYEASGFGFSGGFALLVVLFILLIIIGCSCWGGGFGY
ncbi:YjcZ family sporulation protein [Bacillus cytotoxicus]|nr:MULTISPECIES: YjcZ family sporulation protein [Bacillus cereus group]AWC28277.1 sporulation protein YjcZ [Bacillus cytotoxicus]AWC32307.1 sporulation protein YjcZ [Bacillus cytotoxicus]AWC36337.1 sporulation protein YjcZ [Bacillus cytotoxicus]AWC40338.1 sporulation protein YjcZ [Bacillus cytotoxicus]AWC44357.1 sporulation protein YjcZ [Bacillus cytotoxicus]